MTTVIAIEPYLQGVVDPTVRAVHRRYGEDADLDDLHQEAAAWWYGPGQPYLERYLVDDEQYVRIRRSIWRWCARYALRERARNHGYSPLDQVRYTPTLVLQLLPVALEPNGLPDGGGFREGSRPKGNLAEGGDVLAALIDVRRAFRSLTFDDRAFIVLADDLACDWDRIASNLGILPDSCRRRHARIAERMTRFLNDDLEGP